MYTNNALLVMLQSFKIHC